MCRVDFLELVFRFSPQFGVVLKAIRMPDLHQGSVAGVNLLCCRGGGQVKRLQCDAPVAEPAEAIGWTAACATAEERQAVLLTELIAAIIENLGIFAPVSGSSRHGTIGCRKTLTVE